MPRKNGRPGGAYKTQTSDFWSPKRLLSANKVRRILERMEIDLAVFKDFYQKDYSRGPGQISPEELAAVREFLRNRDFAAFRASIGAKSLNGAQGLLTRVIQQGLLDTE